MTDDFKCYDCGRHWPTSQEAAECPCNRHETENAAWILGALIGCGMLALAGTAALLIWRGYRLAPACMLAWCALWFGGFLRHRRYL